MAPCGNHDDTYRLNLGVTGSARLGGGGGFRYPPGRNLNRCLAVATLATGRGFQTKDLSWLSLGKIRFIVEHGSRNPTGPWGGERRGSDTRRKGGEVAVITPSILGTSHRIDIPVPELDDRLEPSQLLHVECACSAWHAEWIRYNLSPSRSGTTTAAGIAARRHTSPLSK